MSSSSMSSVALHENNNITVKYQNYLKNFFDDIDEVILKSNKPTAVVNNYFKALQDQTETSNVSIVVAPITDDEVVLCQVDGIVKNIKDENEHSHCVSDLPTQETTMNDFSDDEPSPKKSKQFTFTESDLPDSEEIKEFLKSYPRPEVTEPLCRQDSISESESNSEDESNWCSRRRRKKTKPVPKVTIDKLPTKFITRQRVPNIYLVCKKNCLRLFQSIFLKSQEGQMNEDIIRENLKRLKTYNKSKGKLDMRIVKSERKDTKYESYAQKNFKTSTLDSIPAAKSTTKRTRCLKSKTDCKNIKRSKPHNKDKKHKKKITVTIQKPVRKVTKSTPLVQKNNKKSSLDSISVAKTNTRRTRAMKNIIDGRNTKSKSVSKNDIKRKPTHMKERTTLPAIEERRSKRYQKTKEEDMVEASVSTPKKRMHEQSTVYNISSYTSESPKRLKRSLVEDSEVPSPKRTRSQNIKVTNASTPVKVTMKTRHQDEREKYTLAQKRVSSSKRLDRNTKFLNSKTRSNSTLRRRTRGTPRTPNKRL